MKNFAGFVSFLTQNSVKSGSFSQTFNFLKKNFLRPCFCTCELLIFSEKWKLQMNCWGSLYKSNSCPVRVDLPHVQFFILRHARFKLVWSETLCHTALLRLLKSVKRIQFLVILIRSVWWVEYRLLRRTRRGATFEVQSDIKFRLWFGKTKRATFKAYQTRNQNY